ncbi:MAG: type I pantothenate kinase [Arsenophonus sp.]|nr:MAG: type I pantothenate kinase [Arsenophonus sp.]
MLNINYINFNKKQKNIFKKRNYGYTYKVPYIIGITGSVASGKTTIARLLRQFLSNFPNRPKVDLITTDCFLYSNDILNTLNILNKKGFPQSYDINHLIKFIVNMKLGNKKVFAPIYSHKYYNIIQNKKQAFIQPDILIVEGLNIFQDYTNYLNENIFTSNFFDFSIYIDAPDYFLKVWYINRFLEFCYFSDPNSYYYRYSKFNLNEIIGIATFIWENVNKVNLEENIILTKKKANLIITKNYDHDLVKLKWKNYCSYLLN